ncbi:hypothetical protein HYW82_01430 [Candidatus Peregrinibacteria bacterium]|nr:hypothetical protein [Candidatus Peregrinibacteria bacterium]
MSEKNPEFGTPQMSFATFLLRLIAGSVGGVLGSLVILLIFVLASSILDPLTAGTPLDSVSPIFIFILLIMIFLGSTIGNILSSWLLALTERGRYIRISSSIYQIFIINLIIFIILAPVYFLTSSLNLGITAYVVALHIVLSAQVSALILEIVSNPRHALVGVYGTTFSILLSTAALFILSGIVENPRILLFGALPIVWGSIAFVGGIFTILYGWVARTYDRDFLSSRTDYGDDYGKKEEVKIKKAKDEVGAEFLRHN